MLHYLAAPSTGFNISYLFSRQIKVAQSKLNIMSSCSTPWADFVNQLAPSKVKIRDPSRVNQLIAGMVQGGPEQLQLVVDFDYTLTRAHLNGEPVDCSWGVMENYKYLPKAYLDQTHALRTKYLKIEQDSAMTNEEKTPYMIEWYTHANRLLKEFEINVNMFPKMVEDSNVAFRDGTDTMMNLLDEKKVPMLILSAGLGNLVVEVLKHFKLLHNNVKVVSNMFKSDEKGMITELDGEMIHVFNKNENAVHDSPYFKELQARHNVLLLGDSMGDLQMANGVENPSAILKVGFLNAKIEERLPQFMDAFDIVLVDDQTMDVPMAVIQKIVAQSQI